MTDIEINNDNITDKEALKAKDFNRVLDKYNKLKKPFYKSAYFVGGLFAMAILTTYLVFNLNKNKLEESIKNSSYEAIYESPVEEVVRFEMINGVVDGSEPLIIKTNSGTQIKVPSNTLVDHSGNFISGKISFKYREFLDQKDIFLSGIPMDYDSLNVKMNFESGGMFELLAYQNNQPIFIAPNKVIEVNLASKQVGNNFNIYYYSPDEKKWIYKGKDKNGIGDDELLITNQKLQEMSTYAEIEKLYNEEHLQLNQLKNLERRRPMKPVLVDLNKFSFTIKSDYKDFPELTPFKGLKFQVSDKEKNFKPAYADAIWDDVEINYGKNKLEYNVCFKNQKDGKICILTSPVFTKNMIKDAEKIYKKLMITYQSKKDSIKTKRKELRQELAKRIIKLNDQRIIEVNKNNNRFSVVVENRITRTFQISNFGVWNSDCPEKLPSEAIVKADFIDGNGEKIIMNTMYLVLKKRNEVISMTPATIKEGIRYNPDEECMLWGVTVDKKNVATFSSDQFNDIKASDESFTFKMNLIDSKEFVTYSTERIFNL